MLKRRQFGIMVKHMSEVVYVEGTPTLEVAKKDVYMMSENYVFRNKNFHVEKTTINYAGVVDREYYGQFLVLRNDGDNGLDPTTDNRPQDILIMGLKLIFDEELTNVFGVSEMTYKRCLRSASQFRTAKLLACPEGLLEDVRMHASYGWLRSLENKTLKSVAKVEPYIGLGLSSSLFAGRGYTDVNIKDYVSDVSIKGAKSLDKISGKNVIVRYDEFLGKESDDMKLTDGQSICSPKAAARIAFHIGQITKREYRVIRDSFATGVTFAEMLEVEETAAIWDKISRGFQFRYGLKKGFMIIMDHNYVDHNGNQFDFVFPDGANKGEVKSVEHVIENGELKTIHHATGVHPNKVELCIANVSTMKDKNWGLLNYQFIMSLNIGFDTLKELASIAIRRIVSALDSVQNAMAFMGMVDNGDEEDYEQQNALQKIREILASNPEKAFKMKWVKAKIKGLMTKTIQNMAKGRIPLEDSRFVFIVTDPQSLLKDGQPLLKSGECYYNGEVGERAIFRSPLIHKSETVVINLVDRPELKEAFGHMKNILIMNAYDDTLPRMGGADTDGDKVYMTSQPEIIASVERNQAMIYGDTENSDIDPIKWENGGIKEIFKYDLRTLLPSQIGIVTNYCTAIADKARDIRTEDEDKQEEFWELVSLGRILQGKIIDDAKKGTQTDIDDALKVKFYPDWLESGKNRYDSYSPLGRLYKWVNGTVMPAFKERYTGLEDYQVNILFDYKEKYNPEELNRILPDVRSLEEGYRKDVAEFFNTYGDEPTVDMFPTKEAYNEAIEERNKAFENLILHHQRLLASIEASTTTIGMACIHVSENLQRSAKDKIASYPFVVADRYVIALLADMDKNFKLVRMNPSDKTLWTDTISIVKVGGKHVVYNANYDRLGHTTVKPGKYETSEFQGNYFIKVPVEVQSKEIKRSNEKVAEFEFKTSQKSFGYTIDQAKELISGKTIEIKLIENDKGRWLGVMFNGKQIGAVGKEEFFGGLLAEGKQLKVVKTRPINGLLKITAEIGEEVVIEKTPIQTTEEAYNVDELPNEMQIDFDFNIGM